MTSDPERRARASGNHPDAVVLTDVEALWERSAEHDLVVVATPNRFHVPLGLAALEAGLPVVIDKPMAPTAEEGRRLRIAAAERDLFLGVFQNRRWDGDLLTVRGSSPTRCSGRSSGSSRGSNGGGRRSARGSVA